MRFRNCTLPAVKAVCLCEHLFGSRGVYGLCTCMGEGSMSVQDVCSFLCLLPVFAIVCVCVFRVCRYVAPHRCLSNHRERLGEGVCVCVCVCVSVLCSF